MSCTSTLTLLVSDTNKFCRPLPNNITFKKVDLTEPLPFKEETFDIIHARLVFLHVGISITIMIVVLYYFSCLIVLRHFTDVSSS